MYSKLNSNLENGNTNDNYNNNNNGYTIITNENEESFMTFSLTIFLLLLFSIISCYLRPSILSLIPFFLILIKIILTIQEYSIINNKIQKQFIASSLAFKNQFNSIIPLIILIFTS